MSWQDDVMAEQLKAEALSYMGEAEWRDMYDDIFPDYEYEIRKCSKIKEESENIIEEGVKDIMRRLDSME